MVTRTLSSFNGAGPRRARRAGFATTTQKLQDDVLQWGRATEGPERRRPRTNQVGGMAASMGPGHGGPGEVGLPCRRGAASLASMGPGHGGPGEELLGAHPGKERQRLQWGRATEGPESPTAAASSWAAALCFNGAGPRRARRGGINAHILTGIDMLQWGRATEGPESPPHQLLDAPQALASMGPGHGGPGEQDASDIRRLRF